MSLYISTFKGIILAICGICILEASIYLTSPNYPAVVASQNIYQHTPIASDNYLNHIIAAKLADHQLFAAETVIIGDSTAAFAIQSKNLQLPNVYNFAVPKALSNTSLSILLKYIAKRNPNLKRIILGYYPITGILAYDPHSKYLQLVYTSPTEYFFALPSLKYRSKIVQAAYFPINSPSVFSKQLEASTREKLFRDGQVINNFTTYDFVTKHAGWLPLTGNQQEQQYCRNAENLGLDIHGKSYLNIVLTDMLQLLKPLNLEILVVLTPYNCKEDAKVASIGQQLQNFKELYPEIRLVFDKPIWYAREYFVDENHLNVLGAERFTAELNQAISIGNN